MDQAPRPRESEIVNAHQKVIELRKLQSRADAIRRDVGISPPGTLTFIAPSALGSHDVLIVEADGFGGATTSLVEGNYPLDYLTKFEKTFPTEKDAESAAEAMATAPIRQSLT